MCRGKHKVKLMNKISFVVNRDQLNIVISRVIDAPVGLVWNTWISSRLIPHWWGPKRLQTTVERMDVKAGGKWKFLQKDAGGHEFAFNGTYLEIVPMKKIVFTFEFDQMVGFVVDQTVLFEAIGSKTMLSLKDTYKNSEDLDVMLSSGMENGAKESLLRFANLAEKQVSSSIKSAYD